MIGVAQLTPCSCLQACVASILDGLLPPAAALPDVDHDCGARWLHDFNGRLVALGFVLEIFNPLAFAGLWIAEVPSLSGAAPGNHVVVMCGRELVWDPARGDRYATVDPGDVISTFLLVPLDMGEWQIR